MERTITINIPTKVMLAVIMIVVLMFGILTYMFIHELQNLYPEFITSNSISLAQTILHDLQQQGVEDEEQLKQLSEALSSTCQWLYRSNQGNHLTHIAIIDPQHNIIAHSEPSLQGAVIDSRILIESLGWHESIIVLDKQIHHTLVPIINSHDDFIGAIDVGYSKAFQDMAIHGFQEKVLWSFPLMLLAAAFMIFLIVYLMITRPIKYLCQVGDRLAQGHFIDRIQFAGRGDEMSRLGSVFVTLSAYFQEVTDLATRIAGGKLGIPNVEKRSKRDVLGYELQEMLSYLHTVATGASKIAEGDLSMTIPLRSDQDMFGRALQQMMNYLREMAEVASMISTGDLRKQIVPRSERDVLGTAFQHMSGYLDRLSTAATVIAQGDLRQEAQAETEHDVLGNAFHTMAVQLQENFEKIQQEIAERKQAQEALAKERNLLQTLINSLPDYIYVKDTETRFLLGNPSLLHMLEVSSQEELLGKTDFDFYPSDMAAQYAVDDREVIDSGHPVINREEPWVEHITGDTHWLLATKVPLRDNQGNTLGLVGIGKDVTDLKRMQEENVRMGAELSIAQRLQEMILPKAEELEHIQGLDIVGFMQPADEVGGDYYDVLPHNKYIQIGIGDVTGHGLESGVLMLMAQTAIRTLLEYGETDPKVLLNTLNRTLYRNIQRMNVDKSMTLALVNYQQGQLTIFGQHEELLVIRNGGEVQRMDTIDLGFPLGLEEEISNWVAEETFSLQAGDGAVLYTDGITEAEGSGGELYGIERLCNVISRHWEFSSEEIKSAVIDDVLQHIGERELLDDLTLVVLKQQ